MIIPAEGGARLCMLMRLSWGAGPPASALACPRCCNRVPERLPVRRQGARGESPGTRPSRPSGATRLFGVEQVRGCSCDRRGVLHPGMLLYRRPGHCVWPAERCVHRCTALVAPDAQWWHGQALALFHLWFMSPSPAMWQGKLKQKSKFEVCARKVHARAASQLLRLAGSLPCMRAGEKTTCKFLVMWPCTVQYDTCCYAWKRATCDRD